MKSIRLKYLSLSIAAGVLTLASCNDFLDRVPLSSVTPHDYLNSETDLAAYAIQCYSTFPVLEAGWSMPRMTIADDNSDNQVTVDPNYNYFDKGRWRVPESDNNWSFEPIRNINYFFEEVLPKYEAGTLQGSEVNLKQYIGEMYFLRAYEYFKKLRVLGDFPIVTNTFRDNREELTQASKRRPRNEVARFILAQLDTAAAYMSNNPAGGKNRLTTNAALLFRSRVALFEGTWLRYHKGTPFVPGGPNWPGFEKDYNKGFSLDIDAESDFFLTEAMKSAKAVADQVTLTPNSHQMEPDASPEGWNSYYEMFVSPNMESLSEVIFWKAYKAGLSVTHSAGYRLVSGGGGVGLTKGFVDAFLMKNGKPYYAATPDCPYKGDLTVADQFTNRDERLPLFGVTEYTKLSLDDSVSAGKPRYPRITDLVEARVPTGFHMRKYLTYDPAQSPAINNTQDFGSIVFRGVEAYLNYIEACAVKNNSLDPDATRYWQAIRERAGVSTDIQATLMATDMAREGEGDWGAYSGGQLVSPLVYNVRRERRCEFIAEGMRWDDLKRWRSFDQIDGYIPKGFNLWGGEAYKNYKDKYVLLTEPESSSPNVSNRASGDYVCPYRVKQTNSMYNGYTWTKAYYLSPIGQDHFAQTASNMDDLSTSVIYQNPYWPVQSGQAAIE